MANLDPHPHIAYTDFSLNSFKKTNVHYTENLMLKYQDPTYLGFKLMFHFDQPDSGLLSEIEHPNTALGYLVRRGEKERAAYLISFVRLLKRINSECPWFFQQIDGLADAWKRGFNEPEFKPILGADRKITISTLDESVDLRMTALMDLYRKACFDWPNRREVVPRNLRYFGVSVYCYEARTFNRMGAPGNDKLEWKDQDKEKSTKAVEANKLQAEKLFGKDPGASDSTKADYINDQISRVMFGFSYCEWLPDESGIIVDALSNKEMALKPQKLVFSYRNVEEENLYRMFSDKIVTDTFIGTMDALALDTPELGGTGGWAFYDPNNPGPGTLLQSLKNSVKGTLQAKLDRILAKFMGSGKDFGNAYGIVDPFKLLPPAAQQAARIAASRALAEAQQAISARLSKYLLGNVYGFSPAALLQGGIGGIVNAIANGGESNSLSNNTKVASGGSQEGVSLTNNSGVAAGGSQEGVSLSNDDGMDATSQGASPQTSQTNIGGTPSGNYGINSGSLNNDNGPDATSQGASPQTSQNNIDGPPTGNVYTP